MIAPVLAVKDVDASVAFYTEKLGFKLDFVMPGPDGRSAYSFVNFGDSAVGFRLDDAPSEKRGVGVQFMIYVPHQQNIDTFYTEVQGRSAPITGEIKNEFWGDRTFTVHDPDGYMLTFAKNMEDAMSRDELLKRIKQGWNAIQDFIQSLNDDQLTKRTDAGGWRVQDHLIHMAIWEDSMAGVLEHTPQRERMNVDAETWSKGDDAINDVIYKRHKDKSLAEVLQTRQNLHQQFIAKLQALTDDDLHRPYNYYNPTSSQDRPVIAWVAGNTFQHYERHLGWMKAIANSS